jgi:hypothetical protein
LAQMVNLSELGWVSGLSWVIFANSSFQFFGSWFGGPRDWTAVGFLGLRDFTWMTSPGFGVPTVPTSGQQPAGPSGPSSAREDKAEAAMFLSQLKMWNHL